MKATAEGEGGRRALRFSLTCAVSLRYYQLTHDYLVHSLRDWLTRKQRETRRGRAELRLAERAALWEAKPENRRLPSALEWANIRLLTRPRTGPSPAPDDGAGGPVPRPAGGGARRRRCPAACRRAVRPEPVRGDERATAADGLVQALLKADTSQVPGIVQGLGNYRRWADPELRRTVADGAADPRAKLHASLALLPVDRGQVAFLEARLLDAAPADLPVLRDALSPTGRPGAEALGRARRRQGRRPPPPPGRRGPGALRARQPPLGRPRRQGRPGARDGQPRFPRPVARRPPAGSNKLTAPLAAIFRDRSRPETEHAIATTPWPTTPPMTPASSPTCSWTPTPRRICPSFPSPSGSPRRPARLPGRAGQDRLIRLERPAARDDLDDARRRTRRPDRGGRGPGGRAVRRLPDDAARRVPGDRRGPPAVGLPPGPVPPLRGRRDHPRRGRLDPRRPELAARIGADSRRGPPAGREEPAGEFLPVDVAGYVTTTDGSPPSATRPSGPRHPATTPGSTSG